MVVRNARTIPHLIIKYPRLHPDYARLGGEF
jgi:hypothetical protein